MSMGSQQASTPASTDARRELPAASSGPFQRTEDASSSAAQPTTSDADILGKLTLLEVRARLSQQPLQESAQSLVNDIDILEQWRGREHPSNSVRDAMLKLGSQWHVRGKIQGRKRPPADVAKELAELLRKHGIAMLNSSVAQPATATDLPKAIEPPMKKKRLQMRRTGLRACVLCSRGAVKTQPSFLRIVGCRLRCPWSPKLE